MASCCAAGCAKVGFRLGHAELLDACAAPTCVHPNQAKCWIFSWMGQIFSQPSPGRVFGCLTGAQSLALHSWPGVRVAVRGQSGSGWVLGRRFPGRPGVLGAWRASKMTDVDMSVRMGPCVGPNPIPDCAPDCALLFRSFFVLDYSCPELG